MNTAAVASAIASVNSRSSLLVATPRGAACAATAAAKLWIAAGKAFAALRGAGQQQQGRATLVVSKSHG
jgi:hypothetical protein